MEAPFLVYFEIWKGITRDDNGRPTDGQFIAHPSPVYDPIPFNDGSQYYILEADLNQS